jgi:hypothetical protein
VEFTGVELAGGVELAASVEKATIGPMERATTGPRALEGHDGREAWWRGEKTGCHTLARWRYHLAEQRHGGEGGAVAEAARSRSHGDL